MDCKRCGDMLIDEQEYEKGMCFACMVDLLEEKRADTTNMRIITLLDNKIDKIHKLLGWI